jgi:beta-phosphoglucomutase
MRVTGPLEPLAFIFDVDGVLVHSMPLHVRAWEEYLAGMNIRIEDLETRMHGKRNSELVRDLIGGDLSEDVIFNHGAAKEQLWRDMIERDDRDAYRIAGLTAFLERHPQVPKAVASNAEPQNVAFVLDRFDLRKFFPVAVDGMQVERPKPFPDIYLRAAELLGKQPKDCIAFEDSPTGLAAGLAAGMRVVGVETIPADLTGAALRIQNFEDPKLDEWLAHQAAAAA